MDSGIGYHSSSIPQSDIPAGIKWASVFQVLSVASSVTGKFSIMAFLDQIRGIQGRRPYGFWILGALLVAINASDFGTMLGQCQPMRKLWDSNVPGTCDRGRQVNQLYSYFQASMLQTISFLLFGLRLTISASVSFVIYSSIAKASTFSPMLS